MRKQGTFYLRLCSGRFRTTDAHTRTTRSRSTRFGRMRRLAFAAAAIALLVAFVVAIVGGVFAVGESAAELDGNIFRSPQHRVRIVVPRGWRKTDEPSYPGLLLWMMPPTRPPAQIVLTAETFTR